MGYAGYAQLPHSRFHPYSGPLLCASRCRHQRLGKQVVTGPGTHGACEPIPIELARRLSVHVRGGAMPNLATPLGGKRGMHDTRPVRYPTVIWNRTKTGHSGHSSGGEPGLSAFADVALYGAQMAVDAPAPRLHTSARVGRYARLWRALWPRVGACPPAGAGHGERPRG
jgi:hypothetical protein